MKTATGKQTAQAVTVLDGRYALVRPLPAPAGWEWWATDKDGEVVGLRLLDVGEDGDGDLGRVTFAGAAAGLTEELRDWAVWTKGELAARVAGYIVAREQDIADACRSLEEAEMQAGNGADGGDGDEATTRPAPLRLGDLARFASKHPRIVWVSLLVVASIYLFNWVVAGLPHAAGGWYWVGWGLLFAARMLLAGGGFSLVLWLWLRGEGDAAMRSAGVGIVVGYGGGSICILLALLLAGIAH